MNAEENIISISIIKIDNNNVFLLKFKKGPINCTNFNEFLAILEKFMNRGKPFSFIVDSTEASIGISDGLKSGKNLIYWLKKNKPRVPGLILGSAIILSPTYPKIGEVLNWVFQKQKPVSPNIITTNEQVAKLFIKNTLNKLG